MIINDMFGNRVNAESFKLEVIEGKKGDELGKPVLILKGYHSYIGKDKNNNLLLKNSCSIVERCICTEPNVAKLLMRKNELETTLYEINIKIHKELLNSLRADNSLHTIPFSELESQLMVKCGYRFYEKDEVPYEDRLHDIDMTEVEEYEPC